MTKPVCERCGSSMTRVMWGGETKDPTTGKWVKSGRESWRCDAAQEAYETALDEAHAKIEAEFGEHCECITVEHHVAQVQQ